MRNAYLTTILLLSQVVITPIYCQSDSVKNYTIRNIHYSINNVFPEDDPNLKSYQKTLNKYHIKTREEVLKREVLLQPNKKLDEELIPETERKLRQFDFLEDASISVDTVNEDSVDLTIHTTDQWSLIPSFIVESGGGITGFGASVEEFNFLGRGKNLFLEIYDESDVGTRWTFDYYDPQFLGIRWQACTYYTKSPLDEGFYLGLFNPRHSSDSRWSYGFNSLFDTEDIRLFYEGQEISRINQKKTGLYLKGSYSFGKRYKKKKITIKYRLVDNIYSDLGDLTTTPLPDDELQSVTSVGFSFKGIRFAKDKRINNFKRTEDFTLGRNTSFTIGRSGFPVPIGVQRWEFVASHTHGHGFSNHQLLFWTASFRTQFDQNTIYSFDASYYNRLNSWNTLATNLEFSYAVDLQSSKQYTLGGDNGFRGFRAREFTGDKMLIINIEDRIFSSVEFLTLALGGVVFFDAGTAWPRGEEIDLEKLNYSAGFGLRLGYTKAPGSPVVRWDIGWPFEKGRKPGISFGIGQQF